MPSTPEIATAASPTESAMREPWMMRERMSRPR